MITASQASSKALIAIAHKQAAIRDSVQDLPEEMRNTLAYIDAEIEKAAANGQGELDLHIVTLFGMEYDSCHLSNLSKILRAFGYHIDYSFSSNIRNERMFIKWNR